MTPEKLKELVHYNPNTGEFTRLSGPHAGKPMGSTDSSGHRQTRVNGKTYLMHRLAWFYVYGVWPAEDLDHIDRNPLNNSIKNLRECSRRQNCWNRGPAPNNTTGFKGVHIHRQTGLYRATITADKKRHCLGLHKTSEEAFAAYRRAAQTLHKEFAYGTNMGIF